MARAGRTALFVLALLTACLWLGAGLGSAANNAVAAKARLAEARRVARYWHPDAVLVAVSARGVDRWGRVPLDARGWTYTFYSPGAVHWMRLAVEPQGFEQEELTSGETEPLPGDFVDSDAVMAEVQKNGFEQEGRTLLLLTRQKARNGETGIYWCAVPGADANADRARKYCVDPATGGFVGQRAERR